MSWQFNKVSESPLFWISRALAPAGQEVSFKVRGEPDTDGYVLVKTLPVLVRGKSSNLYPDGSSAIYQGFQFAAPDPSRPRRVKEGIALGVPLEDLEYACVNPAAGHDFFNYELIAEASPWTRTIDGGHYLVSLAGPMTVNGTTLAPYEIARISRRKSVSVTCDHPVLRIWEL